MKIGTIRPEEASIYDSLAGFHQFHTAETQEPYGSFEIFWDDSDQPKHGGQPRNYDEYGQPTKPGWYWWACFPGCLPDGGGQAAGPFASSNAAHQDADEWSHDYDD